VDKMIEVRYAGAVVGRSAIVRELDTNGMFLGTTEPMPVGTLITLKIGDQTVQAKVATVAESQELARAGMRVRFADPASAALFGAPAEATEPATPFQVAAPRPAAPQAVPQELSRPAGPELDGSQASSQVSAPRRIVVDASTESAAVPAEAETAPSVATSVPATEPVAPGDGGNKKNRRNKRR
jgi:hypothetical protein